MNIIVWVYFAKVMFKEDLYLVYYEVSLLYLLKLITLLRLDEKQSSN